MLRAALSTWKTIFSFQEINTSQAEGKKESLFLIWIYLASRYECIDAVAEHAQQAKIETCKPWLWWDFLMAFSCILIIPSALPESLSHVLRHKCSCLIPSEDVLACLYESNLRISAWIGKAWGQPSHVFLREGVGCCVSGLFRDGSSISDKIGGGKWWAGPFVLVGHLSCCTTDWEES